MVSGRISAVCSSAERGVSKRDQGSGYLEENYGLREDAHAGPGERQVSILLEQFLEPVIEKLGCRPDPGCFAENLLVSGLPESAIERGALLRAGEAVIRITAIGKNLAERHRYSYKGFSLLAERGLFGRVIRGGWVEKGDAVELIEDELC